MDALSYLSLGGSGQDAADRSLKPRVAAVVDPYLGKTMQGQELLGHPLPCGYPLR
jgi:hypothetical protein